MRQKDPSKTKKRRRKRAVHGTQGTSASQKTIRANNFQSLMSVASEGAQLTFCPFLLLPIAFYLPNWQPYLVRDQICHDLNRRFLMMSFKFRKDL